MLLSPETIATRLAGHPEWTQRDGALERTLSFDGFLDAYTFVGAVAHLAEKLEHHPDVTLTYGEVKLRVWSHDVDGITERDFKLISAVDAL